MMMDDSVFFDGTLDTVEFALINLVKGNPELYNAHDPAFRDKRKKDLAWAEIARQLSKDEGWCYAKWKNLSDYYKKRKKVYGNGAGGTMRRWVYYDALSFLDVCENTREDSSSSSNATVLNYFAEHSRSSTEGNRNYFDETQYQSLDGITERTEIKLRHFRGPPSVETANCPPAKKHRGMSNTNCDATETPSSDHQVGPRAELPNFDLDEDGEHEVNSMHIPLVTINDQTTGDPYLPHSAHTSKKKVAPGVSDTRVKDLRRMENDLNDCPHFHFCMSLLARFKKMNPATATFTQMKIMEVLMKTQFPEEFKQRNETENRS